MKKNELALLIFIVGIVGFITYFTLGALLNGNKPKPVTVEVADELSSTIVQPSEKTFVSGAYNPTIKINIGNQANQQPFNTAQ